MHLPTLQLVVATLMLVAVACGPAAQPAAPTAAPKAAAPTAAPQAAAPTAAPAAQQKPAETKPAASAKPTTLAELATYRSADREQILLEGARQEGTLTWYTSLAGTVVQDLARGFEEKYSGIKVQEFRANTEDVITRISEEYQTRRYNVDVLEINQDGYKLLLERNLLVPYWSPHLDSYPENAKEPAPGGNGTVLWVVDRQSFIGFGYNTNLIPASDAPKTWADLANPALHGKMVVSGSGSTGPRVFGAIQAQLGSDWIRNQLWPQNYVIQEIAGRAVMDLIVSGEAPSSPTIFRNHALEAKGRGAPVDWAALEPVPTNGGSTAIPNQAQHPHAALLWVDFILGPDGQKILEELEYGSAAKNYGFEAYYPEAGTTARDYDAKLREWEQLMRGGARRS